EVERLEHRIVPTQDILHDGFYMVAQENVKDVFSGTLYDFADANDDPIDNHDWYVVTLSVDHAGFEVDTPNGPAIRPPATICGPPLNYFDQSVHNLQFRFGQLKHQPETNFYGEDTLHTKVYDRNNGGINGPLLDSANTPIFVVGQPSGSFVAEGVAVTAF